MSNSKPSKNSIKKSEVCNQLKESLNIGRGLMTYPGLVFIPIKGGHEGIWHRADYLIGDKDASWTCKYRD